MRYNSIDQFLTLRGDDIKDLMKDAMKAAGGVYATFSAQATDDQAVYGAERVLTALRQGNLDRSLVRASAQEWNSGTIPLADMRRSSQELEPLLRAWANRHLHEQPDLEAELLRRINNMGAGFRSTVTSVQLDDQIARFNVPKPKAE
jgi:hypothetical protein